jgi:hypothetical protein
MRRHLLISAAIIVGGLPAIAQATADDPTGQGSRHGQQSSEPTSNGNGATVLRRSETTTVPGEDGQDTTRTVTTQTVTTPSGNVTRVIRSVDADGHRATTVEHERGDRPPRGDHPGVDHPGGDHPGGDRPGGDRPGGDSVGGDRPGGDRPDLNVDRPESSERSDRVEAPDLSDRPEVQQTERADRPDRPEKADRIERTEKSEHPG